MRIEWSRSKEEANVRKHGFDFSFFEHMAKDSCAVQVYDRYENGEDRWHLFSVVGGTLLLAVFSYPDPDDAELVRVIGLRRADSKERRHYEEGDHD